MPSIATGKRSRLVSLAATGTLLVAGAISAATVALPAAASAASNPAFANVGVASQQLAAGQGAAGQNQLADYQMRLGLGTPQFDRYEQAKQAAEKAAATKAAAAAAAAQAATKAAEKAVAEKAATEKAAAAKAQAQAQAKAKAQTQAKIQHQATGSPQQIATAMLGQYGWSASQFACLNPLWAHESGWSVTASNPGSGAYGIPQALPGSKMESAGPDWQTNAATQIRWGLNYIQGTYGSPCAAWSHEESDGWY
ncbi:MAG TPA: lytic transglycosylase domain-containing protein [Trebonia sp.]